MVKAVFYHWLGNFKLGIFVWLFIGLMFYFLAKLYGALTEPVTAFSGSWFYGFLFVLFGPYLTGGFLSSKFIRKAIDYLVLRFPRLFFLKYIAAEDIKERRYPEVEIEINIGDDRRVYILGCVTKRWIEEGNPPVVWCRVIIPTYPLIATGNLLKIKESHLIYTGRQLQDSALTFLSFGAK